MNAETVNQATKAGRARAEAEQLGELTKIYLRLITAAGRRAAQAFRDQTALVAATNPRWTPPGTDLINANQLTTDGKRKTAKPHEQILRTVTAADVIGIDWTITHPTSQMLLASVASRLDYLNAALRLQVSETIQAGYDQGWSVAKTAAAIVEKVDSVAPARAAMYARTDLNALSNGGSLMAAQIAGVAAKTWVTAGDDLVRETHADADGQTMPIDQPFDVGGEQAMYPGDPDLSDEEALNCRCTLIYDDALAASTGPDVSELAMVAVYPRPDEADAVSTPDGQDAADMHCTLVFLGNAADLDIGAAHEAVRQVAEARAPLAGTVGGCGMFAEGPDGSPSIMLPDVQGLSTLREHVVSALDLAGIRSPSEHGFLPHLTRDYVDAAAAALDMAPVGLPLHFDQLSLTVGGLRTDYPLAGDVQASALSEGRNLMEDTATLTALRELAPSLETLSDAELLGVHALILAATKKHDYRGDDGEACAVCGEMASADCHYEASTEKLTLEIADMTVTAAVDGGPTAWQATLLVEGVATEDGRLIALGATSWRALPLPLGLMLETPHSDIVEAPVCGRIDQIWRAGSLIQASGVFNDTADDAELRATGLQAVEAVRDRIVKGVSVDLLVLDDEMIFEPAAKDEEDASGDGSAADGMDVIIESDVPVLVEIEEGRYIYVVTEGVIGSACVVPVPGIAQGQIQVITADATHVFEKLRFDRPLFAEADALVAAVAPLRPPAEWFDDPKLDRPTPLTIDDEGRVYGHVALWSSCHQGFPGRCIPPPRSRSGYSLFHVGAIKTADGDTLPIGKITLQAPHADVALNAEAARAHYDNTGTVAAFVRAGEDQFGPWIAGALRSDAPEEIVRDLLANPLSGDWRSGEMIAAHAVPSPGFPVLRAAAFDEEGAETETALIMTSPIPRESDVEEAPMSPLAYLRPGRTRAA